MTLVEILHMDLTTKIMNFFEGQEKYEELQAILHVIQEDNKAKTEMWSRFNSGRNICNP